MEGDQYLTRNGTLPEESHFNLYAPVFAVPKEYVYRILEHKTSPNKCDERSTLGKTVLMVSQLNGLCKIEFGEIMKGLQTDIEPLQDLINFSNFQSA